MGRTTFTILIVLLLNTVTVFSQIINFPHKENFDLITTPALPAGWNTTTNKNINGDFTTSTTTVRSAPNALSTTDATKSQSVVTSYFNFKGRFVDSLEFYERRTSTHTSGVLIEAAIGNDTTFSILIADTLKFINGTSYIRRNFSLPATLNNKDSVRFRWRVVGNGSGATGVLRIDDITLTVKKAVDLALTTFSISPLVPKQGDQLTATTTIKNRALAGNFSGTIQLFDSLTLVSSQNFTRSFALNESLNIALSYPNITAGRHPLTAKLVLTGDEDTTNNALAIVVNVGFQSRTVLINEFMYAPPSGIPEWVECINNSADTIFLSGWKISDAGTTKASLLPTQRMISPYSYFIVTTDTASLKEYYSLSVPVFQASFSALNNTTADAVVIFDQTNSMIDSVMYTPLWGGSGGNSLQRYDFFGASTDSSNWKNALPNPGIENLSARKEIDVEIKNIAVRTTASGLQITAAIFNSGRQAVNGLMVKFYHDKNDDSTTQNSELIDSVSIAALSPLDSMIISYHWNVHIQGKQPIIVEVEAANDMRMTNNVQLTIAKNNFAQQTFVINEIMYEPLFGKSEFVELYNRTSDTVDIAEWKLMDQSSTSGSRAIISLAKNSAFISPGGFVLVASDSSIFSQFSSLQAKNVIINSSLSLSNGGEDLVLMDLTDTQIDSVRYSPLWHLKNISPPGRSLERINPSIPSNDARNWSSSVATAGSTPAASNSIFTTSTLQSSSLNLSPNPFSPDNDGFEDFLTINYSLPANSTTIRVRIFDVTGRLVRRLAQSELSPSAGSMIWNGLDDEGNRLRIGMYIVLFEALDNFGGTVKTMKDVAVVARKL